jgi:beta-mannosidase
MVRLLYNHPSVVVWCMHNEAVFTVDTADERRRTRWRTYNSSLGFNWTRDVLDTQLQRVAQQEDHWRPVVRSSGEPNIPRYREGTDAHFYFGWYASYGTLQDAEMLRRRLPGNMRFVTEFGAQSFPNRESCVKFMHSDIKQIDFELLSRRHSFQSEVMARWIPWRSARSLDELIELTQEYQCFINRYYIDRLRVAKYRPTGGIVPFMFQDSNPAVQWSILDYWRVPKRSYAAMRMAFSPQYACAIFEPRSYRVGEPVHITLYAVNDARRAVEEAQLHARLGDGNGAELARVSRSLRLGADCLAFEVDRLRFTPSRPGRYMLELALWGVGCATVEQRYMIEVTA